MHSIPPAPNDEVAQRQSPAWRSDVAYGLPSSRQSVTCARLAASLLAVVVLVSCSKAPAPAKASREDAIAVTLAKVELVPLDRTLPVVGTLCAKDEATVAAQVEGRIEATRVDLGDRVKAGQELALIDTASYEALTRQSAANVAKAKASALNAEQNLKRVLQLQASQISSASEFDLATAQAEQARAEVLAAEAADAIAQLNLQRSKAGAPFEGAVAERIANAGDYVKVGAPLFRLVNDNVLKFIVQAPERNAAQVKKEQPVRLSVDAWPGETFEGKVFLISPAVTTSTRSFNLGALIPNPDRKLKADTFARGELILECAVPTPVIPLDAVVNFAGVTKVFVIQGDVARSREIKVARVYRGQQEVLEGLKPGELVALTGQTKLFEGAKVRLQSKSL